MSSAQKSPVSELLLSLQGKTKFPIEVDEVADFIKNTSYADNIFFYEADIDPQKMYGKFAKYFDRRGVYGNPDLTIEVCYYQGANTCWTRFICCKEMLHAFDYVPTRAKTAIEVSQLASQLTNPLGMLKANVELDDAARADMCAEWTALCVLAPLDAVEAIKSDYKSGKRDAYSVATLFRIPVIYVPVLFEDIYEAIYTMMLELPADKDGVAEPELV